MSEEERTEELQVAILPSEKVAAEDYRRGIIVLEFATPRDWPESAHDRVVHAIEALFGQTRENVYGSALTFEETANGNGPGQAELLGLFMKSWVNQSEEGMPSEAALMKWRLEYPLQSREVQTIDIASPTQVIRPLQNLPVFDLSPLPPEEGEMPEGFEPKLQATDVRPIIDPAAERAEWERVALDKLIHLRNNVYPRGNDVAWQHHEHSLLKCVPYLLGRPDLSLEEPPEGWVSKPLPEPEGGWEKHDAEAARDMHEPPEYPADRLDFGSEEGDRG